MACCRPTFSQPDSLVVTSHCFSSGFIPHRSIHIPVWDEQACTARGLRDLICSFPVEPPKPSSSLILPILPRGKAPGCHTAPTFDFHVGSSSSRLGGNGPHTNFSTKYLFPGASGKRLPTRHLHCTRSGTPSLHSNTCGITQCPGVGVNYSL